MKILFTTAAFLSLISFSACKKSDITEGSFTWNFTGTKYDAKFARAYKSTRIPGPTIIAHLGTASSSGEGPIIHLTSFSTGTYQFALTGANTFDYIWNDGTIYSATSGSLQITVYNGSRISGNFLVNTNNSVAISGTFTDVRVED